MLIRLLSRLVKDFTNLIHTYFSSSKTAPSVASETSADGPSDQFFPPRAKLLGPASSGRFARTGVSFRALVMQPPYKKMQWDVATRRKRSPSNFCSTAQKQQVQKDTTPGGKGPRLPSRKTRLPPWYLGVGRVYHQQTGWLYTQLCLHIDTTDPANQLLNLETAGQILLQRVRYRI